MHIYASSFRPPIDRWINLHPDVATHGDYVIEPEYVIDVMLKNASSADSSGIGAVVLIEKLEGWLQLTLTEKGNKAFGHAVRRHFQAKLRAHDVDSYYRLDVAVFGDRQNVTKCLILIHTDHPPR